jgi:hypothetical protein
MWVAVWARAVASRRACVHLPVDLLALADLAGPDDPGVHDDAAGPELRIGHRDRPTRRPDQAPVADLAAGLRVERRPVQDEADLLAFGRDRLPSPGPDQREQPPIGLEGLVPHELGRACLAGDRGELLLDAYVLRRTLPAPALLLHQGLEPVLVDLEPRLGRELARELFREAERVVELEDHIARQPLRIGRPPDLGFEQRHPLAQGAGEPSLFRARDLLDVRAVLHQLRVHVPEPFDRPLDQRRHDFLLDPESPGVRDDAAEHPAHDVAAALVGGLDAIGHQERGRATVLADHLERDVVALVVSQPTPRERFGDLDERTQKVGLERVGHVLQHDGQALHAGAGVDVLAGELAQDLHAIVDLVLHEDVVPDLDVALLVDLGSALGP